MATDIGEELLKEIEKSYGEEVASDTRIKSVLNKIENKSATYSDVLKYASELGECLASAIKQNVSESVLPDGKMYYNIAKTIMEPMMQLNYQNIAAQCDAVQTILNESAGLGLKAVTPSYNQARTESLINYISMADNYSDREKSFLQYISNDARMIVDNAVQGNADFHYKSGLNPQIVRRTSGLKPCKWCQSMAGVYNYYEVKNRGNEVFRRHSNCNCTVTYDPGDNSDQVQDVWSKTWRNAEETEKRKQQISLASRLQNGTIYTGARKITNPNSKEAWLWAEDYYNQIRAQTNDCGKIAERVGLDEKYIQQIKNYLFIDDSYYDVGLGTKRRFPADAAIAQSWQRLSEHMELDKCDYTMIEHELFEMNLKKIYPNLSHTQAHDLTTEIYNYQKESDEYYDKFNKSKKNR